MRFRCQCVNVLMPRAVTQSAERANLSHAELRSLVSIRPEGKSSIPQSSGISRFTWKSCALVAQTWCFVEDLTNGDRIEFI